jgi:hypothetical protein
MIECPNHLRKLYDQGYAPPSDDDLEMFWMVKLGILKPDVDESEAYLRVGAVYRLPLIRQRCEAKARAAGKAASFGTQYIDDVVAALTPEEITGLRKYVRENPEE